MVQPFTAPPQYSQQPLASGVVVAPQYGAFPVCRNYTVRAHIRDVIPEKWSGRADAVGNAGTFQCGIHHQHLRSLNVRHETERSRHDWKHPPKRDLTPKPKRRLQLAAAVQTFKIFLKTEKLVLFCQINLNKSTAFLRQIRPFSQ